MVFVGIYLIGACFVTLFNYCAFISSDVVEVNELDFDSFAKYAINEQ